MSKVIPSREPDYTFSSLDGDNKYWFEEMIHVYPKGGINSMIVNDEGTLCMESHCSHNHPIYINEIQKAYQSWCVESVLLT